LHANNSPKVVEAVLTHCVRSSIMISSNCGKSLSVQVRPQPPDGDLYEHCRLYTCPFSKLLLLQHRSAWHTLCEANSDQASSLL